MSMFGRPVYRVEDKLPGNYWTVAFYTDDLDQDAEDLKCEVGSTMCIKNSRLHQFFDGQVGYRIEDASTVTVLPCTIAQLRTLSSGLRQRSDAGNFMSTAARRVNHATVLSLLGPLMRGLFQQCQRQDWKEHRVTCKALKALLEWNIVFA
ncbi:uncharacterized protein EV420DRAFT_1747858 [Desarmillaria tabescens]|uniref:Uncharacterized protein n=1 Tax=Armillaria tabescens TaxID=1929756 RepID=A0AA39KHF2_ARMTA|nr:uncharacterized protein EV420DRAFT_1747858 [Desarmillaria tabescens]KAK0458923.1 hypothetical protein EV420DRAFT_1747858 [Desarmillaria tabescens]